MGDLSTLKAAVAAAIRTNGNQEITGQVLQNTLTSIINTLGTGAQYMGIATPSTNPGTPDAKVFYIASANGTYSNFGGITVSNEVVMLVNSSGSWVKQLTGFANVTALNNVINEIGTLSNLQTQNKSNLVAAINEVLTNLTTLSNKIGNLASLTTEDKTNIVAAINEIVGSITKINTSIADILGTQDIVDHSHDAFKQTKSVWYTDNDNKVILNDYQVSVSDARAMLNPISLTKGDIVTINTSIYSMGVGLFYISDNDRNLIRAQFPHATYVNETYTFTAEVDCLLYINKLMSREFSCSITKKQEGRLVKLEQITKELETTTQTNSDKVATSPNLDTDVYVEAGVEYELTNNGDKQYNAFVKGDTSVYITLVAGSVENFTFATSGYIRLYASTLAESTNVSIIVKKYGALKAISNKFEEVDKKILSLTEKINNILDPEKQNIIRLPKEFPTFPFNVYKGIDGKYHATKALVRDNNPIKVYVDPINGNNAKPGTFEEPVKSTTKAVELIGSRQYAEVVIIGDVVLSGNVIDNFAFSNQHISFTNYNGNRVIFSKCIPSNMYPTWSTYTENVYKANTTLIMSGFADIDRVDENGVIIPFENVQSLQDCISKPFTCYQDPSTNDVYVHGDSVPNNITSFINYSNNRTFQNTLTNGGSIEFHNIEFITQGDDTPIVDFEGDNTGWAIMKNCKLSGGSYKRTTNYDRGCVRVYHCNTLFEDVISAYNNADGFQYFRCDCCIELNCKAYYCGIIGTSEEASRYSMNASTTHAQTNIIRCNFEGHHCSSPIIGDVGEPKSVLIDVHVRDCIYSGENSRYGFVFYGDSTEGAGNGYAWMQDCSAGGQLTKGMVIGYVGYSGATVKTLRFDSVKGIEVRNGELDTW